MKIIPHQVSVQPVNSLELNRKTANFTLEK